MSREITKLIREAGWYPGTETDWRKLPMEERERLAFEATGCLIAYATWEAPVDCVHTPCRIRRGELPGIQLTKNILACERESGWLRDLEDETYEKVRQGFLELAEDLEVYDPWKIPGGWQAMVRCGVGA